MADNKVKFLRGTSDEYAAAEKDNDTIYFTTNDGKLYIGDKEVSGDGSITIDDTLSDTSTNPVQNKIVKQAIDNKADKSKYGDSTINVGRKAETDVGEYSTAEGQTTTASGAYSHAEGYKTIASGIGSHAEGSNYFLSGVSSSRKVTISNGEESTIYTIDGSYAYGINSHAEGTRSFAYGSSSHAEGCDTTASGSYSHAEGRDTIASGSYSHAEGDFITASGAFSHAEGNNTTASGNCSHAEGCKTTAGGRYSHAGGYYTKALKVAEFAHGKFNQSNSDTLFSIGDGTADDARHNAFEITTNGGKLHDKDIATTDLIPTTLPANGGNADTVDGMHANDFTQIIDFGYTETDTKTAIGQPGKTAIYRCIKWTDYPSGCVDGQGTIIAINYNGAGTAGVNTMWVKQIFITPHGDSRSPIYMRGISDTNVGNWQEISTTPIKSTGLITSPTDEYGTIILPNSDTRRYLSIAAVGCYAEMLLFNDKYTVHIANGNYEKVINTPVTYIAFYIE